MRNDSRNLSSRVALGGIVAALCIVIMFLTGVLPALYIAAPMATTKVRNISNIQDSLSILIIP